MVYNNITLARFVCEGMELGGFKDSVENILMFKHVLFTDEKDATAFYELMVEKYTDNQFKLLPTRRHRGPQWMVSIIDPALPL